MRRDELLPGVRPDGVEPMVRCHSQPVISRARRAAAIRDAINLGMLLAVDVLVIRWPAAHVPFASRSTSLAFMGSVTAAMVAHIVLSRRLSLFRARRIAATWSSSERRRVVLS